MAQRLVIEGASEFLVKYFDKAEEEVILLTGSELIEALNTGLVEGEQLSWINLEIPTGFIQYSFLDKEWEFEDGE